jgi:hypothetical protein
MDTTTRDAGQTVSKWTGSSESETMGMGGWNEAKPNSLVVMVDQLWLWIVDAGMAQLERKTPICQTFAPCCVSGLFD